MAGQGPSTTGTAMRFAAYNVHVSSVDVAGHLWSDRAQLVANNIAAHDPAVVGLAEMIPGMWTNRNGGPGLDLALGRAGIGQYELTRDTGYADNMPGDGRILYDPNRVQMTSNCDPTKFTCAIKFPGPDGKYRVAPYAKFKDLASGQEFWFVALHFDHGNDSTTDALRGDQSQAIVDGMAALNTPAPARDHQRRLQQLADQRGARPGSQRDAPGRLLQHLGSSQHREPGVQLGQPVHHPASLALRLRLACTTRS